MKKSIALLIMIFPGLVIAAEETKTSEWKGEGELGFTSTSGNTDSESLNTKLGLEKSHNKWTHKAGIEVLKSSTDGVESANSKIYKARSEYKFGKKSYAYGALRYEDDRFSGYDYQTSVSLGAGQRFIETEKHILDASAGPGYRWTKEKNSGKEHDEAVVIADMFYQYNISKTASLKEKISVESGESNTHSESESSLKMKINGNLASKITHTVKHNSTVPAGTEHYDRITSITLVYSF